MWHKIGQITRMGMKRLLLDMKKEDTLTKRTLKSTTRILIANPLSIINILKGCKNAITEYIVCLWHSMVEFVTVFNKDNIRFTIKDRTEISV